MVQRDGTQYKQLVTIQPILLIDAILKNSSNEERRELISFIVHKCTTDEKINIIKSMKWYLNKEDINKIIGGENVVIK